MRVNLGGTQRMLRNPSENRASQCTEAAFGKTQGNECYGDASLEGGNTKMREGSYSLVRHNSAVIEHDFDTNRSSLVHMVSEVREEIQLRLSHDYANQMKLRDGYADQMKLRDGYADHMKPLDGYGSDGKPRLGKGGLVRQVSRESHEFSQETYSASPATGKKRQIKSFVLKNYSLHDRRTSSLPLWKEYSISQYFKGVDTHSDRESNSKNVTYSERRTSVSSTSSSCDDGSRSYDFDMEAERHSKSTLFFQAGSTLLTAMMAMFTLYFCIRFLTSESSGSDGGQGSRLQRSSSGVLQEKNCVVSHCRLYALLGVLTAGFVVVAGAWVSDCRLWQWSPAPSSCGQCEDYEDNRRHAEEAEEKVRQADRSKHQFMAYVFHNIRVPFNAIVLGLGHIRAQEETVRGNGPDKMDLVQMMLDCSEAMTSVLDDVTDMDQWEGGQIELHKDEFDLLAVIKFLSWGLKDLLEQKEIAFNMNIDEFTNKLLKSHRVIGDKQRVVQTLGNFLSNAVKFTPSGGKLDLDLQCEDVIEAKKIEDHVSNLKESSPSPTIEGSPLGATSFQILSKTSSQGKNGVGEVARLRLSVKDNGIGISAEDQAKLFEPYSFVTSGWVLKAGVSGLGLSMAKRFVERVGGSIGVESEEGSGSTFFFSIPFPLVPVDVSNEREQVKSDGGGAVLQKSEVTQSTSSSSGVTVVHESMTLTRTRASMKEEPESVRKAKLVEVPLAKIKTVEVPYAKSDTGDVNKGRADGHIKKDKQGPRADGYQRKVLLVEDTRINRIILRKVLLNLNLECDEAENGQIAVDLHRQGRRYDLVLMDKEMPVMDGHEATRQLRSMGVKTPIVALTGNALTTDRELFFEAGVDDFQTKPLSRDKLIQLLARYGVENSCSKRT